MNKFAIIALASAAALSLGACKKTDTATDGVAADTVEMPAEEAMSDASGMPSDMATSDMASDAVEASSSAAM